MTKLKHISILILGVFFCYCSKQANEKPFLLNELSPEESNIHFKNELKEDANHSIINYIYFYNGGGVASGDVNNDGLEDLYFVSNMGKNKLYLNKGNLIFEDVSIKANIEGKSSWNTGVTMVDINNDGFLDIYVCAVSGLLDFKGHNELFVNNGDGTFTEKSNEYGLDFKGFSTQSYFFDYDKDGDLDVYIVNHAVHTSLSFGPADTRYKRKPNVGDVLLVNDNGFYKDYSEKAGIIGGENGYGLSISIADFNDDNWDDIYVCNDFHEDDYYYINNQDGTFKENLAKSFSTTSRFSMGSDAADINGDGFQDIITLDMLPENEKVVKETEGDDAMLNMYSKLKKLGYKDQYSRNMLQINNSGNYFHETALLNGIAATDWSWGPLIADFDNDGYQDIFISNGIIRRPNGLDFTMYVSNAFRNKSNGDPLKTLYKSINEMPNGEVSNQIFKGNSKAFFNKTGNWIKNKPTCSNGAIYTDLDNDGDLDLVLNNLNNVASVFENTTNGNKNFLTVKLNYVNGNSEGIGSKVKLYYENKIHIKQMFKSRGFLSSTGALLSFGLDSIKKIDSLEVLWPNNTISIIKTPAINQKLIVNFNSNNVTPSLINKSKDSTLFEKSDLITYSHVEDNYNDFFFQKLIPYKVSMLGPAFASGDIDNNGYEDFYIGNSSGKKPKFYLNNGKAFVEKTINTFLNDSLYEDNDALFFDVDNDGDLDLYVATGINYLRKKNYENDRLYINQNGEFNKSDAKIPDNFLNTSCLAAYDYDNDGDEDLFVGNLSNMNYYGDNVESFILKNDGHGNFMKDPNFSLSSQVTSAVWKDINNDGLKDLLVSAQWTSPKVYLNSKGVLQLVQIPENLNGMWESITSYDIDHDGDNDILLGNWGLNTRFFASKEKPLKMYYSDFDNNGDFETILAYNKNGAYYPLHSKSMLASQMIFINKRFPLHSDFAGKTINQVFTDETLKKAKQYDIHTLASGYIVNENGVFNKFEPFSSNLQLAPINSFDDIKLQHDNQLIISGNSKKVSTYHGAYTSLKGYLLKNKNINQPLSKYGISPFNEQIKKTAVIKMKEKKLLLVIKNNDSLISYTFDK